MIKKNTLLLFILFISLNILASIPEEAQKSLTHFVENGFLSEKEGVNIHKLNSRFLSARQVNQLLNFFSKHPEEFSTREIIKLGKLCGEFSEELRFMNLSRLDSFTTLLKLLQNRIITTKSVVLATEFHTIGQRGIVEDKKELIEPETTKSTVYLDRAKTCFNNRNYDQAAHELNQALLSHPDFLAGCFWLGRVYVKKGDYLAAVEMWEKVVTSLGSRIYIDDFIDKVSDYNDVFMEVLEVISAYPEHPVPNKLLQTMQENLRTNK
ncbi:MAG: tetratricopeptide repeat protein [Candidatus Muiribacteriota bacterium]